MSVPNRNFERIALSSVLYIQEKKMLVCSRLTEVISLYFKRLDVTKNTGPKCRQVKFPYTGVTMS